MKLLLRHVRRHYLPRCVVFVLCVGIAVIGTLQANADEMEARVRSRLKSVHVRLSADNTNLVEALRALAEQAGISLLSEADPIGKRRSLHVDADGMTALEAVSKQYNYEWRISKSGIVLLSQNFTDEYGAPQIIPEEMAGAVQRIVGYARLLYTPLPKGKFSVDVLEDLVAGLPPETRSILSSGGKVPVRSLNSDQQNTVVQVIYVKALDDLVTRWAMLTTRLGALRTSRITRRASKVVVSGKYVPTSQTSVIFDKTFGITEVLAPPDGNAELPPDPDDGSLPVVTGNDPPEQSVVTDPNYPLFFGELPASDLLGRCATHYNATCTILPELAPRRVIAFLYSGSFAGSVQALTDLHDWRVEFSEKDGYRVGLKRPGRPETFLQVGAAMRSPLPADVQRFVFRSLKSPKNDVLSSYYGKGSLPPYNPSPAIATLMGNIVREETDRLLKSDNINLDHADLTYKQMTSRQKLRLKRLLLAAAARDTIKAWWVCSQAPASYQLSPLDSFLGAANGAYGVIGPSGDLFAVAHGPALDLRNAK